MKKVYALLLAVGLLTPCVACDGYGDLQEISTPKTIAYVPLDDRPVNVTRVEYLAESAGFTLKTPPRDLFKTCLDNQPLNQNGTQHGDIEGLLDWVEEVDASYYVLSVDQMLSGGLANSRTLGEESLDAAYQTIDALLEVVEEKKVVLFDTVLRLSTTVGYQGCTMDEYSALRQYGVIERTSLDGEYTLEDIFSSYRLDENGQVIPTDLSEEKLSEYLSVRKRKISIADYLLKKLEGKENAFLYYGIDDSGPKKTIQTNEIHYIEERLEDGAIFAGTDELGLMSLTKAIGWHYEQAGLSKVKAKVSYFGECKDEAADWYDVGSLEENVEKHLQSLDVTISEEGFDFEYLVLTKPQSDADEAYLRLIEKIKGNAEKRLPTIVVDASSTNYYGNLEKGLILDEEVNLAFLLGYSNWNTVGNAVGVSLSNGLTRYLYLSREKHKTQAADEGFAKSLAFSFYKDISYKIGCQGEVVDYIQNYVGGTSNFYVSSLNEKALSQKVVSILKDNKNALSVAKVQERLNKGKYISDLVKYKEKDFLAVEVTGVSFPWYRTFELDFTFELIENE